MIETRKIQINVLFASALIATISWRMAFSFLGASIAKMLYALCMWIVVILSMHYTQRSTFDKKTRIAIFILIGMAFVSLGISVFYPDNLHVANKWLTLFGNPFCFLTMIAPLFVYLSNINSIIKYIKVYFQYFLLIGLPFVFLSPMGYSSFFWFVPLFFPYLNKVYRMLCLLMIGCSIFTAFFADETSRTNMLILFFCILNYMMVSIFKDKRSLLRYYCLTLIFLPMVYSILTLIEPGFSIFEIIFNWLSGQTSDTQLVADTRSFLFAEIHEDLSKTNSWLLGKGADGHYYSLFFDHRDAVDSSNRMAVEVTFLMLLLRGGVIYTVGYYLILILAVLKTLKYARSNFMLSCALMISAWSFMTFVSLFYGCDLLHVLFFAIVGCCCSSYWLSKDDNQIKSIILQ